MLKMDTELDLSFVLPARNEEATIAEVIDKAKKAAESMKLKYEVIVADNSSDATPSIAREHGARVVVPDKLGYGYAYRYAFKHVRGKYIVMADADGTYNLEETPKLLEPLLKDEADVVLGTRLKGRILPGAMPWLHRYIGNPLLTFILNRFYGTRVSDAHTGFRALTRRALEKLNLRSSGMDFASEFLIKAAYAQLRVKEIPIVYYPRRKGTSSKLSSFKDGWRHLKLMLLLAPKAIYYVPGVAIMIVGIILMFAALFRANLGYSPGLHSSLLGSMLTIMGYSAVATGLISDLYLAKVLGRYTSSLTELLVNRITVEKALAVASVLVTVGFAYTVYLFAEWVKSGFRYLPVRGENVIALTLIVLGVQTVVYAIAAHLISSE